MTVRMAMDFFEEGKELYKNKKPCPGWDGTGITSYVIKGWEEAAREAKEPGYECDCVSFECPYH